MSKWNNHKKPTWTKQDNFFAYLKISLMILVGGNKIETKNTTV